MVSFQDYHLLSPLLKIHTHHLHHRLHERYVVPCSVLMLEEISRGSFLPQSSTSSKEQCEAHFVRFSSIASIYRFLAHLQRDDNLKKKLFPIPFARVWFKNTLSSGERYWLLGASLPNLKWPSWGIEPICTKKNETDMVRDCRKVYICARK